MSNDHIVIAHDADGHFSILRRIVRTQNTCQWCGQNHGKRLFQYGFESDALYSRPSWDRHCFCSKSCRNAYCDYS